MRADPADQKLLLDIQAADVALSQLAAKLRAWESDAEMSRLKAAAQDAKTELREALALHEDLLAELVRAESDVSMVQARIERDSERLEHATSAKDAQGLEHEIQSLRTRMATLEEVQLEVMERLENADRAVESIRARQSHLQAELALALETAGAEEQKLRGEVEQTTRVRAEIAARVPAELLALYERQRERYGYGASLLQGGVSGASGVVLTESDLATVRQAAPDEVVLCPDSNAILVRTEHSGL